MTGLAYEGSEHESLVEQTLYSYIRVIQGVPFRSKQNRTEGRLLAKKRSRIKSWEFFKSSLITSINIRRIFEFDSFFFPPKFRIIQLQIFNRFSSSIHFPLCKYIRWRIIFVRRFDETAKRFERFEGGGGRVLENFHRFRSRTCVARSRLRRFRVQLLRINLIVWKGGGERGDGPSVYPRNTNNSANLFAFLRTSTFRQQYLRRSRVRIVSWRGRRTSWYPQGFSSNFAFETRWTFLFLFWCFALRVINEWEKYSRESIKSGWDYCNDEGILENLEFFTNNYDGIDKLVGVKKKLRCVIIFLFFSPPCYLQLVFL